MDVTIGGLPRRIRRDPFSISTDYFFARSASHQARRRTAARRCESAATLYGRGTPRGPGWSEFVQHLDQGSTGFSAVYVVPTIGFELLYAFVIVRLDRRDMVWINVTANPTAEWVARQITRRHFLIRDRDQIYGAVVTRRLRTMGIRDKPTAPASPWQNGFAERLIGSIRRECLDHIIVLGEVHLRRILKSYADYYNGVRTHRSLNDDAQVARIAIRSSPS